MDYKIGDRFHSPYGGGFTITNIRNESGVNHPILTVITNKGNVCRRIYPSNIDNWLVQGTFFKSETIKPKKYIRKLEWN